MAQTFSPVCSLQDRSLQWAILRDGVNLIRKGEIMVMPAWQIAGQYRIIYGRK